MNNSSDFNIFYSEHKGLQQLSGSVFCYKCWEGEGDTEVITAISSCSPLWMWKGSLGQ